jgi:hypothetical protein
MWQVHQETVMPSDRYLKAILTVIAIELGWMAITQNAAPVSAQAQPMPVVIAGINLADRASYLPVGVLGQVRNTAPRLAGAFQPLDANVRNEPLNVTLPGPVDVRPITSVEIQNDRSRPLWVENVGYTGTRQPGE